MPVNLTERCRDSRLFNFLKTIRNRLLRPDSKKLFSQRTEDYDKYRPSYPEAVLSILRKKLNLRSQSVVADLGSGTGIFSRQLLQTGAHVYGVEPNGPMREAAERNLKRFKNFTSVKGSSENTTLPAGSVDLITAAQSFHWFNSRKARSEFQRILRPKGWVCVLWNIRKTEGDFLGPLEGIINQYRDRKAGDINRKDLRNQNLKKLESFYGKKNYHHTWFDHSRPFTLEELLGFLRSQSYLPQAGTAKHQEMAEKVRALFHQRKRKNKIRMEFQTEFYWGRFTRL